VPFYIFATLKWQISKGGGGLCSQIKKLKTNFLFTKSISQLKKCGLDLMCPNVCRWVSINIG